MRVGRSLSWFVVLGTLIVTPAVADEIVYFSNGTSLPISSHRVEKDMISVELGADSRMGFPLYMVDKIESSGQSVYLNPVYHPANQAVAGAAGAQSPGAAATTITGAGSVPSRFRSPAGGNEGRAPQGNLAVGDQATGTARFPTKVGNRAFLRDSLQRNGLPMPLALPNQTVGNKPGGGPVRFDVQRGGVQQQQQQQQDSQDPPPPPADGGNQTDPQSSDDDGQS